MSLRVASVAWKLRHVRSDGEYFGHLYDLVNEAHKKSANVLVLPELTSLELLPLAPDLEEADVPAFLVQFAEGIEEWLVRISASSGITLVGGSHFRRSGSQITNACVTVTPNGQLSVTMKNRLTGYERDFWRLAPGDGLSRLPDPRFGTLVCYDSEFPGASQALVASGVQAILVPAFTESQLGFERVRSACESCVAQNQVYAVHASLVGSLGYGPASRAFGSSAILAPNGVSWAPSILVQTPENEEGVAVADLDFEALPAVAFETRQDETNSDWRVS